MEQNFNEGWKYCRKGETEKTDITLPHDAMIHEQRDPQSKTTGSGAYFPGGIYEYEKEFDVPAEWENKVILVRFEGIYRNAEITVNEKAAGKIVYGYTERTFDISSLLSYGVKNTMKVVVDNSQVPNSRWYSGSGIYRPVTLIILEQEHIVPDGVKITTLSCDPAKIAVEVRHTGKESAVINVEILKDGQVICGKGQKVSRDSEPAQVEFDIPQAHLWSADDPFLYTCRVTLSGSGEGNSAKISDSCEIPFGIRIIRWTPKGLYVNGQETLLRGGCIHHDNGILGACAYQEAEERSVRIMKEYGFNAIRSAHNPCSRAMLEACDRLGMYMMDETWDMWYQHKSKYDYASDFMENYKDDLAGMVQKDYNHPSVILYSIGNEVSEPAKKEGMELAENMQDILHGLDGTRPVTAGINLMIVANAAKGKEMYHEDGGINAESAGDLGSSAGEGTGKQEAAGTAENSGEKAAESGEREMKMPDLSQMDSTAFNQMTMMIGTGMNHSADSDEADQATSPILDMLDIAGYNYASGRYPMEGEKHPDRIVFGSETFPQDIPVNWAMVEKYPYLIGDFMWTAWDYLGEAGIGAWSYADDARTFEKPYPWLAGGAGVIDMAGHGDGGALLAKAVWGKNNGVPGIAVTPANHPGVQVIKSAWRGTNAIPTWSWKGCEGNPVTVEVYTKAAKAVLFLNGEKIGEADVENCKAVFETVYQPGVLSAETYDEAGNAEERGELKSSVGKESIRLRLDPGTGEIEDGRVVFVEVDICGENGEIESNADEPLTVSTEGAELLGFGSGERRSPESFVSGTYTTYYGRALAAVRITDAENAKITVKGNSLGEKELKIEK